MQLSVVNIHKNLPILFSLLAETYILPSYFWLEVGWKQVIVDVDLLLKARAETATGAGAAKGGMNLRNVTSTVTPTAI